VHCSYLSDGAVACIILLVSITGGAAVPAGEGGKAAAAEQVGQEGRGAGRRSRGRCVARSFIFAAELAMRLT